MNNTWTLATEPVPGAWYGVLDPMNELIGYGTILLWGHVAGEQTDEWLLQPRLGYPQWVVGRLVECGSPPAEFMTLQEVSLPLDKRLEIADSLLARHAADQGAGDYMAFVWCGTCSNMRQKRVTLNEGEEFQFGTSYTSVYVGSAICSFLRPEGGLCMGDHG